jgi:hypothetical protein
MSGPAARPSTTLTTEGADVKTKPECAKCWYCERLIAINQITGGLRYLHWPKDQEPPSSWIVPGEACPGVGEGRQ